MALNLYEAAPCEKELWIVEGAIHAKSYYVNPEEYRKRIKAFYDKYL
jgi:fermentation-respiration switch protein FrsA (DUF1100 family)